MRVCCLVLAKDMSCDESHKKIKEQLYQDQDHTADRSRQQENSTKFLFSIYEKICSNARSLEDDNDVVINCLLDLFESN